MAMSEHAPRQQVLLLISTLLILALQFQPISAQQQYNNVTGYLCTGAAQTSQAYAYNRTQGTNSTLNSTATLFNTTAAAIANASTTLNTTSSNALLGDATGLTIPLACGCYNGTYQSPTTYKVVSRDTMAIIANRTFEGLVSYQAIMAANPTIVPELMQVGDNLKIPVRCACPTTAQELAGTEYLLSYAVYPNEDLTIISKQYNVSVEEVKAANTWPNNTVDAFSTVLVPLKTKGSGSNGGGPAPAPSAASRGFQAHLLGVIALIAVQSLVF
jgi:LysM repeat protein